MNTNEKLLVKMFYTHFDNGEIMSGRYAIQHDENRFTLVRSDGLTKDVTLGEYIQDGGTVSQDHNKNIKVGDRTIIVGGEPIAGWFANATTSSKKFHIFNPDGKKIQYEVGQTIPGLGKLEQDEFKRIFVEGKNIPIFRKEREISLLCFPQEKMGGYKAFFNVKRAGDKKNGENGIEGVFFPGKDGKPSRFCEKGPDGNLYTTAQIRPNDNGSTVRCVMRTLEDAVQERLLLTNMKEIEETEAKPFDISPTDVVEYVKLQELLNQVRGSCWDLREFSVTNGHRILGLPNKRSVMEPTI